MKTEIVGLAGRRIEVHFSYFTAYALLRDFFTTGSPDFTIQCYEEDYAREAVAYEARNGHKPAGPHRLEPTALLRKIAEGLLNYDVILLHGATVALDGSAYLFTGPSGIGKTTHVHTWVERQPNAFVVNGDKALISFKEGRKPVVYGSPWSGKEGDYTNIAVPLDAVITMDRGERNIMTELEPFEALPYLVGQVHRPDSIPQMVKTLDLLRQLTYSVRLYSFSFDNFAHDCFTVAHDTLCDI